MPELLQSYQLLLGAPPPRVKKYCQCYQFSWICCIFLSSGNLRWSLIHRLSAPIAEVIIHQLPIKGTLVICVTIIWLSKLAFCARSLTSASTLSFLLYVEEFLSIHFDSRDIFWRGVDVNATSRLATIVKLWRFAFDHCCAGKVASCPRVVAPVHCPFSNNLRY
jgi:hypothetical protein